jgi:hypothetical protein
MTQSPNTPQEPTRRAPSVAEAIGDAITRNHQATVTRAIVTGNDTNQVNVRRPGYASADGQSYPKLEGTTVVADDEVLLLDVTGRGGWIVLGKIVRN